MMIKRYRMLAFCEFIGGGDVWYEEEEHISDGEWVRYTDHEEAVAEAIKAESEWAAKAIAEALSVGRSQIDEVCIVDVQHLLLLESPNEYAKRVMTEREVANGLPILPKP